MVVKYYYIEFHGSTNVEFVIDAATTPDPTETQKWIVAQQNNFTPSATYSYERYEHSLATIDSWQYLLIISTKNIWLRASRL